jgi:hypothetical protein
VGLELATKSANDEEVLTAFVVALTRAWDDGSPVGCQSVEQRRKFAAVALHRIRSFERRSVPIDDRVRCIRDLAKGFADQFEAEPSLVGPFIEDYRYVAAELLDAYRAVCGP